MPELLRSEAHSLAPVVEQAIRSKVKAFAGGADPPDDMTLLVLVREEKERP